MYIIGERINGMYKRIAAAIRQKDKKAIQEAVRSQVAAGVDALDVNCGPLSKDPVGDMRWLIECIQEVTDKPLSLDSSRPEVIEAGLEAVKNRPIINSTTADAEKLDRLIPLALRHNADLIGIAISSRGIPQNKDQRIELAALIVNACAERGFALQRLYLDPIVMPLNVAQPQMQDILETIRDFKVISEPAPQTVIGLSNVSQGARQPALINRSFLVMALAYGLDAAILDPCDKELVDSLIASELILNKQIYCESFLEAYRKR